MDSREIFEIGNSYIELHHTTYEERKYTFIKSNIPEDILKSIIPDIKFTKFNKPYVNYYLHVTLTKAGLLCGGGWDKYLKYKITSFNGSEFIRWLIDNDNLITPYIED